jgi:hypothetical protein
MVFSRYTDFYNLNELTEKIYWQLHTDTSLCTKCADKYLIRVYKRLCSRRIIVKNI